MCRKHKHSQSTYPSICVGAKLRAQLLARENHEVLVTLPEGMPAIIRFEDFKDPSWWSSLIMTKNAMDVIKVKIIRIDVNNQIYVVPTDYCAQIMSNTAKADISMLEDEVSVSTEIRNKEEKISRLENLKKGAPNVEKFRINRKIVTIKHRILWLQQVLNAIRTEKTLYKTALSF